MAASYSVVWSPDPASSPWFSEFSHVGWGPQTITATVQALGGGGDAGSGSDGSTGSGATEPPPTVTKYTAQCTPETPAGLTIEAGAEGVTVSAPNGCPTAFPFLDLEYQIDRVEHHCTSFEELPEEADEVISFIPDSSTQKDWGIVVTAHLSDGATDTATFTLRLLQNYDSGRNLLVEAVNARRS